MKGSPSDLFHFATTDSAFWRDSLMVAVQNEKEFQSRQRRKPTDSMWLDVATKAAQRYHALFGERDTGWRDSFGMASVRDTAQRLQDHYAAKAREELGVTA